MPTALITGVNGQDGSYLAEFLLAKGYRIVGTATNLSATHTRIPLLQQAIELVEMDLLNQAAVEDILGQSKPDEVYNFAARASSRDLWTDPVTTGELNGLSVGRLLDGIRKVNPQIRFAQASSSEVFGNAGESPQSEDTAFRPRNPYGVAKAYGHWTVGIYREYQKLFACSCILYNHESPRRGLEFVTRKISRAAAAISLGLERELRLGRLDALRDWGFAGDYVEALWLALQHSLPDDYILATGETHSVREFCQAAFRHVGLDYREFVVEDLAYARPAETAVLVGNPAKAHRALGWKPKVGFQELVRMMVDADLRQIRNGSSYQDPSSSDIEYEKTGLRENLP
jgi:GDPmannose 4,6-dehydratase